MGRPEGQRDANTNTADSRLPSTGTWPTGTRGRFDAP